MLKVDYGAKTPRRKLPRRAPGLALAVVLLFAVTVQDDSTVERPDGAIVVTKAVISWQVGDDRV